MYDRRTKKIFSDDSDVKRNTDRNSREECVKYDISKVDTKTTEGFFEHGDGNAGRKGLIRFLLHRYEHLASVF